MNKSDAYDFAIIGAGAAGLQLALKMAKDPFFHSKRVLIIEKDAKNSNDRTWSFWEIGETHWDSLAYHTWNKGLFITDEKIQLDFYPYRYKTIRSADFYAHAKAELNKAKNMEWIKDEVSEIKGYEIVGAAGSYKAKHTFDSRVSFRFGIDKGQYDTLTQHFKGWIIETEQPVFDPDTFTMMDYRLRWKDSTSFTYILPFSTTRALVEFTLFNQELLTDEEYDICLMEYIARHLGNTKYEIKEVEKGIIPMTDYPFHYDHQPTITKIGTAGGWVRPSSGYSFKNADRLTSKVIENVKTGAPLYNGLFNKKHFFYDGILLKVLAQHNHMGKHIFNTMFKKHPTTRVFRFLDGESTLLEELQIITSLNPPPFIRAFLSKLIGR